ncbi:MAG: glycosyltransferase family 4 protein [Fibrobacterota bacterium]
MEMELYMELLFLLLLFFIFSTVSVYILTRSSLHTYFIDTPDRRKMHQLLIPRMGGFAFILSFFASLGVVWLVSRLGSADIFYRMTVHSTSQSIIWGSLIIFSIGFLDDSTFLDVKVAAKFIAQLAAASLVVFLFDIYIDSLHIFGYTLELGFGGKILTLFWIVGVTNSFNIIDGIDGLSASLSLITLFISSVLFVTAGQGEMLWITIPVAGVISGFLLQNYPPAQVFAGDTGSLFFGFIAALLSVRISSLSFQGREMESFIIFTLVALPVVEVIISMVRRFWYGLNTGKGIKGSLKNVVSPDNLHMHHRLIYRGLNHEQALRFLIFFSFSLSSISFVLFFSGSRLLEAGALIYFCLMVFLVLKRLEYGKSLIKRRMTDEEQGIRKNIAVIGANSNFENSLRYYTENRYWIAVYSNMKRIKRRYFDFFIIYRSDTMESRDVLSTVSRIKEKFNKPIFIIDSSPVLAEKIRGIEAVYIIRKPVDIPYLIHDMEQISKNRYLAGKSRIIDGTIAVESYR